MSKIFPVSWLKIKLFFYDKAIMKETNENV